MMGRPLHTFFSLGELTSLQQLQDSFAAQKQMAIALFSPSGDLLGKPSAHHQLPAELEALLSPFSNFILLNPPHFSGLGLQDGNTVFATFFTGSIQRAIVPVMVQRQLAGAAQIIAFNDAGSFDRQRWRYILDGFAWNEVSYLAFLDDRPQGLMSELMQNAALFQAQLIDLLDTGDRRSKYNFGQEPAPLQPLSAEMMFLTNCRGDILTACDGMVQLLKYDTASEMAGLNAIVHLTVNAGDQEQLAAQLKDSGSDIRKAFRVHCKDGSLLQIDWIVQPQRDDQEQQVGWRWNAAGAIPVLESELLSSPATESLPLEKLEEDDSAYSRVRSAIHQRAAGEGAQQGAVGVAGEEDSAQSAEDHQDVSPEQLSFLNELKLPVFAIDADGRIIVWNKPLEALLHIHDAAVLGMSFAHLLVEDSLKLWQQWLFDFRIDKDAVDYKPAARIYLLDNSGDAFALRLELTKHAVMDTQVISALVASCEKATIPVRAVVIDEPPSTSDSSGSRTPGLLPQERWRGGEAFVALLESAWTPLYTLLQRLGGERIAEPALRELVLGAVQNSEHFSRLLQEAGYASGAIPLHKIAVNLPRLVRHAANTQGTLFDHPRTIEWQIENEGITIEADLVITFHMLVYLLEFIRRHQLSGTPLRIQVSTAAWPATAGIDNKQQAAVLLEISLEDAGLKIPPLAQWPWPLSGQGDLDLAAVHAIAEAQGSEIRVHSGHHGKHAFRFFWPAARVNKKRPQHTSTVLVIEDEPGIVQMNTLMLEHAGYHVYAALSGQEGMKLLQAHETEIGAILLDWQLPDMTCEELMDGIHALTSTPVILSSGFIPDAEMTRILEKHQAIFLQKPYMLATLAKTIDKVMHRG